ncbi:putative protein YIPF4 [Paratrimastix pyriformis]|uniref:Protein YIPF n=1 Tax=Paratrimastix pyriformis TaxID=342808 RepID=A0ABQ8UHK8_9EUKA|nr:putative protein YIPF4 [Paratrimastix pyriformis]
MAEPTPSSGPSLPVPPVTPVNPPQLAFTVTSPNAPQTDEFTGTIATDVPAKSIPRPVVPPLVSPNSFLGALQSPNTWVKGLMEEENSNNDDIDYSKSLVEELDIHPAEIIQKVKCIILPYKIDPAVFTGGSSQNDFWGPFSVVLLYAVLLVWGQFKVLGWVIMLWLLGSAMIHFIARSLGAGPEISYSQVVQVLGYSCISLCCTVLLTGVTSLVTGGSVVSGNSSGNILGWVVRLAGTVWASMGAARVLCVGFEGKRWLMLAYPIGLLFLFLLLLY